MKDKRIDFFMEMAIKEAEKAFKKGEVPVGSVAVLGNEIVAKGHNNVITKNDPTAHAEIIVLRKTARKIGNYRLNNVEIFVTVEPCLMCQSALLNARVKSLYFGAYSHKWGFMTRYNFDVSMWNYKIKIWGGILKDKSEELLKNFFMDKR